SNVIKGFNENEVVQNVQRELSDFHASSGITISMGGQQEDIAETMGFLGKAGGIAVCLIFLILVLQFNSFSRTLIILSEIMFSIFGVILGYAIFNPTFSLVMSGIGIVALAGIVVRNGILLVEFMDLKLKEGLSPFDAIMESGRTRMTPVI